MNGVGLGDATTPTTLTDADGQGGQPGPGGHPLGKFDNDAATVQPMSIIETLGEDCCAVPWKR